MVCSLSRRQEDFARATFERDQVVPLAEGAQLFIWESTFRLAFVDFGGEHRFGLGGGSFRRRRGCSDADARRTNSVSAMRDADGELKGSRRGPFASER